MDPRPVISVHVPKCGGTSSLRMFRTAYGQNAVQADYSDMGGIPNPAAWMQRRPVELKARVRVVHGHFPAAKYDLLRVPVFRMTFLRHPVETLISVYYFFQQNAGQPKFMQDGVSGKILRERLTLRQMAEDPTTRGSIQSFFRGWDMSRMDFVGCHERRVVDLARLSGILGVNLNAGFRDRVTHQKYNAARTEAHADSDLMGRLRYLLADDIQFYERWTGGAPGTP
jgi:hypothetical protein